MHAAQHDDVFVLAEHGKHKAFNSGIAGGQFFTTHHNGVGVQGADLFDGGFTIGGVGQGDHMQALAQLASEAGAACADAITRCVTAAHALELLLADSAGTETIKRVAQQAARTAQLFAGRPVSLHLFHTDGRELLAL